MSMQYIRDTYNVLAKRGARIKYTGHGDLHYGVIVGARNGYLRVRFDGEKTTRTLHPKYEVEYLDV